MKVSVFENAKFLSQLEKYKVDYILVTTDNKPPTPESDVELWLRPTERNKQKLIKAINAMGFQGDLLKKKPFPQYVLTHDISIRMYEDIRISAKLENKYSFDDAKHFTINFTGKFSTHLRMIDEPTIQRSIRNGDIPLQIKQPKNRDQTRGKTRGR